MQSTLQHADPHEAIAALLRSQKELRLANDPSELNITPADRDTPAASPAPSIEPPLRAAPLNDNTGDIREPRRRARPGRGIARVLLTVCVGAAATIAWQTYGEEVRQRLSHLAPQLLAGVSTATDSANTAEPQDAASQVTAPQPTAEAEPTQATATAVPTMPTPPATAAVTPTAETAPAQATLPPELAQSIEAMSREIALLRQTVEQLTAGQQQLSRDLAKAAEYEARRKLTTQTSRPASAPPPQRASPPPPHAAAAPRAPLPYSPPQTYPQGQANSQGQTYPPSAVQREAYTPPPAPTRLPPEPGYASVPRPPMPLQ